MVFFKYLIILICLGITLQEEKISLLSTNGTIAFTKINDYSLGLSSYKTNIQYLLSKSLISIEVVVTSDIDSSKAQSQPIRVYSKLNEVPRPESFFYDKKDDIAQYNKETNQYIYNFEYTPCEISIEDVINIKIVGIEGTSTFNLNVYLLNSNEYKIICPNKQKELKDVDISRVLSGLVKTSKGVAQFGGKKALKQDNSTLYESTNDMFIFTEESTWTMIDYNSTDVPSKRYGMGIQSFDQGKYIVVFGGKNDEENYINDMWLYNVNDNKWYMIYDEKTKVLNSPYNKEEVSSLLIENHGIIILYGGSAKDSDNTSIYSIDISVLKQFIKIDPSNTKQKLELYSKLFSIHSIPQLGSRYAASLSQISKNEVMIFGGIDNTNGYVSNNCDIINIDQFSYVEKITGTNIPLPRAHHGTKEYGNIVYLYGGVDSNGHQLNDMWKYVILSKTWVQVNNENIYLNPAYNINLFHTSSLFMTLSYLTQFKKTERPLVFSSNIENEILLLNIPICQSDTQTYSDSLCLPCEYGFELSRGECEQCFPGKYFKYEENYSKSNCVSCPAGTYNEFYGMKDKSACLPCPYGTYNGNVGQLRCDKCASNQICLIGSTEPMKSSSLNDYITNDDIEKQNYLSTDHYPEFIDQNSKMKYLSLTVGLITVTALTTLVIIIIIILLKTARQKTIQFLMWFDFLPLTGGNSKKSNGGLITIVYSILISSLAISFILRYVLWNDIVEITTLDDNTNTGRDNELKSSYEIEIDLYGENIPCQFDTKEEGNFTECSSEISFAKNDNETYFLTEKAKMFQCKKDNNICHIRFQCENCKHFINKDTLNFNINNSDVYVSLYKWTFKNYWNDFLPQPTDYSGITIGHSILNGIFKPNEDIQNNQYVFKGDKSPSKISLQLSPIFYSIKSRDEHLSGYRLSLVGYTQGEVRNEYSFGNESKGVKLLFEFSFNQSRNMVTVKKDISLLDFFAFILGMLAGFSFLSRVSKFIFEKCNVLNYSENNFTEFKEEIMKEDNKSIEMSNNQ